MKVMFDTNIYIGWIRDGRYSDYHLDHFTTKFMSSIVLMELWAGAVSKDSARVVEKLQRPYMKANRIVHPTQTDLISAGRLFSALPPRSKPRRHEAGFLNDVLIALSALSNGLTVITSNKVDFALIGSLLADLRVTYVGK